MKIVRRDPTKGYLDTNLWVPKSMVNEEGTKNALSFPVFDRQSIKVLQLWKETASHILVPREFWEVQELPFPVVDCRPLTYEKVDIRSRIKLDHYVDNGQLVPTGKTLQRDALHAMMNARGGVLQLACGKGKTVVFLELVARLGVPTLIMIDNSQLLSQWRKEIERHLDVPGGVGLIQGDVFDWKKAIVLSTYQTMALRAENFPEEARRWFGLVGWDEGHHVSAPTFSRTADLFFGRRIALTATPERDDGTHVVYQMHIGKVLYKDLRQELRPRIYFKWTGLGLTQEDLRQKIATHDRNGELHIGKLAVYFGQWTERLYMILSLVQEALDEGRKILVLSNSIDELMNLFAIWNGQKLYTDIAQPKPSDVGERLEPVELTPEEVAKYDKLVVGLKLQIRDPAIHPTKKEHLQRRLDETEALLEAFGCWKKIQKIVRKRQADYLKDILSVKSDAGIMIHKVPPEVRDKLLATKRVVFAVSKYGREGLDNPELDTIITCEPMSSRNALQQFMGRVLRRKEGKKSPVVVFLEDNIGPMIGMCQNLRRHLRDWPADEGGPYEYENVGHPTSFRKTGKQWTKLETMAFGQ